MIERCTASATTGRQTKGQQLELLRTALVGRNQLETEPPTKTINNDLKQHKRNKKYTCEYNVGGGVKAHRADIAVN